MDQLVVALDVDRLDQALQLADVLRGAVGGVKVGNRLFTAEGPRAVTALVERGDRVFLDLKFHDIPHTVAGAVAAATRLGVWMINVHAGGGRDMMRAAKHAACETAATLDRPTPLVIGVTVLTSLDETALRETGVDKTLLSQVEALAGLAHEAGLDGVVASPHEIATIRSACGERFAIVTPGIRLPDEKPAGDDQSRTITPSEALRAGATAIVVGRPIIAAPDPRRAAERIVSEMRAGLEMRA